jgi:hypothetical protein
MFVCLDRRNRVCYVALQFSELLREASVDPKVSQSAPLPFPL